MRFFVALAFALALTVSASQAQVPEGGAIHDEEVTMDRGVMEALSKPEVLAMIQKACGRFGGKLSKITVSQDILQEASYKFHFGRAQPSPLRHGLGFFIVTLRFGREGGASIKDLSDLVLMRGGVR